MVCDPQGLSDLDYLLALLGHLPHHLDLEFLRITIATHNDLFGCHESWRQGVYEGLSSPCCCNGCIEFGAVFEQKIANLLCDRFIFFNANCFPSCRRNGLVQISHAHV